MYLVVVEHDKFCPVVSLLYVLLLLLLELLLLLLLMLGLLQGRRWGKTRLLVHWLCMLQKFAW